MQLENLTKLKWLQVQNMIAEWTWNYSVQSVRKCEQKTFTNMQPGGNRNKTIAECNIKVFYLQQPS